MKKKFKKQSIRFRLSCSVSALLLGVFMLCWGANELFLPTYYQYSKCQSLKQSYTEVYEQLNQSESKEADTDKDEASQTVDSAVELALEKWSADNNISIYVVDWLRIYYQGHWIYQGVFLYPSAEDQRMNEREQQLVLNQMGENYGDLKDVGKQVDATTLYEEKSGLYSIVKVHDDRLDSEYLELVGSIKIADETHTVYMRTNYESIQESVKLSSQFLVYAALLAILIGIIVMFVISDSFTKPIRKLSKIAHEMSELNFETEYTEQRKDELGDLGHSINVLSEKLETTISELKSANNELKSDIESKIQIDEMRKEFLSNVTHELKTPIALIQGYAEGLQDNINEDPEDREFYCEVIIDEANKMNNMVKKLLNLNQIEFGKNQIEFERFDIVAVIQSVLNSNQLIFAQKEVTVIFEQQEPVYVWADEYMTQEVVTNYVSNALNHVDGEKIIEIKMTRLEDVVRIAVRNTGEPIPEDDLEKVWIKFYKVDKARTREYGGSGIGLSIVKAIMNSMHRECGVYNTNDGVEFWFDLDTKES